MPGFIGHFRGVAFYSEFNGKLLKVFSGRVAYPIFIFMRSPWLLHESEVGEKEWRCVHLLGGYCLAQARDDNGLDQDGDGGHGEKAD